MAPKNRTTRHPPVDPPCQTTTKPIRIPPSSAQASVATYLSKSRSRPHLHPDCFLSTTGIRLAIGTGPSGGIALHHLRRIEAGLRGEVLENESREELEAKFGPQASDDRKVDGEISKSEEKMRKAKKRKREEIEDWVSTSSDPAAGDGQGYLGRYQEIESFANTPVHRPSYSEGWEEAQDPYDYDLQQRVWTKDPQSGEGGGVGSLVRQDGRVPEVATHDADGKLSREERKRAKKQRKEARKMELARANETARTQKPVEEADAVAGAEDTRAQEGGKGSKAEKKARKEEKRKRESEASVSNGVEAKGEDNEENTWAKKERKREEKKQKESKPNDVSAAGEDEEAERERVHAERLKRKKEKREKKKAKKGED